MRDESSPVHIYALIDPRTEVVRYIGQTASALDVRLASHIGEARSLFTYDSATSSAKLRWLCDLLRAGYQPTIEHIATVASADADAAEQRCIATYRDQGALLTNGRYSPRYGPMRVRRTVR